MTFVPERVAADAELHVSVAANMHLPPNGLLALSLALTTPADGELEAGMTDAKNARVVLHQDLEFCKDSEIEAAVEALALRLRSASPMTWVSTAATDDIDAARSAGESDLVDVVYVRVKSRN